MNRLYPYQRLLPDVWSECLSYLPPDELSEAFALLPLAPLNSKTNRNCQSNGAEQAAWLSVRSMVEIAENYWQKEASNTESNHNNNHNNTDTKALELQRLLSEDTSMVAGLFRNPDTPKSYQLSRFRDETWQDLYGFLYNFLSEAKCYEIASNPLPEENFFFRVELDEDTLLEEITALRGEALDEDKRFQDPEAIALVVGLVFGHPQASMSRTQAQREKLKHVCEACKNYSCGKNLCVLHHNKSSYSPTEARSYVLALRLAKEGFWDYASKILQSKINSYRDQTPKATAPIGQESLLLIDGMIYVSTFLIDRLYSQTYVRRGEDDNELATAVRLGRKSVAMAKQRYESFKEGRTNPSETDASPTKAAECVGPKPKKTKLLPPPPLESLFEDDALRYIHSKLALGKALSLLAQHIGLRATDTVELELEHGIYPPGADENLLKAPSPPLLVTGAAPPMVAEQQRLWTLARTPIGRQRIAWPILFFEEARAHLQEGLDVCHEYTGSKSAKSASSIHALRGALESAEGERKYCASSAFSHYAWTHTTVYYITSSIDSFSTAFRKLMKEVLRHVAVAKQEETSYDRSFVDSALDCLLRCGKDFGKTCSSAEQFGVDYRQRFHNQQEQGGKLLNHKLVFDFVYLVSIYRHGSFHPTTENIERLAGFKGSRSTTSLAEKYSDVVTWLVTDFGSD